MKDVLFFAVLSVMPSFDQTQSTAPLPAGEPPAIEQVVPPVSNNVEPMAALVVPAVPSPAIEEKTAPKHCLTGKLVMIPDGREGHVTSYVDGVCRVLAYGEGYVSLWQDEMVEVVYPQAHEAYSFGH